MIRLLLIIRSLDVGGAERQLIELAKRIDKSRFSVTIATFYDGGGLRAEIEGYDGVEVVSLHKAGRWDLLLFLWRLARLIRAARPQVIHGYMNGANELALAAGGLVGARSVWGLRASNTDLARYDWLPRWLFCAGAWLSRFPALIIVNSYAGKRYHLDRGYHGRRMIVIHNGIDTDRFQPSDEARQAQRRAWGVHDEERLIGLVGRLDPMKDHATFLRAGALLRQQWPQTRLVCVGDGPEPYRRSLCELAAELGIADRVLWTGALSNMAAVYNALDIVVSSSAYGEGFSNVIGEAMACATPCVATDVGDSALIVGNPPQIVPPRNPALLMDALARLLGLPLEERVALAAAARDRIVREYNLDHMARKTEAALASLRL